MHLNHLLEKKAQSNASSVTIQLLKELNIPVTNTSVIDAIEQHPDYPSLYSISDSLKKWKIENLALKVEPDKLDELPLPFIAHSKRSGGQFLLVNNVNGTVDYIDEKGKKKKSSREEFAKEWDQVVLLAEKEKASGEPNYAKQRKKELLSSLRIPFVIASSLLLVVLYAVWVNDLAVSSLQLIKLMGCVVTGLLLWFEIDKSNAFVKQICSAGKNTNCTAVLGSKQSKVFGWISWSEVGFFYFAGGFLFSLSSNPATTVSLLGWLNLLALPYTVFSVFYQWRIAKQWCPLCLAVQALLVLEFIVCYFGFWQSSTALNLAKIELLPFLLSFLLPVFFWTTTKKVYLKAQEGSRTKKELAKLKYNKEIFTALLSRQKKITTNPEGLGITLGNPNATNTIIKVCNPYCGPCAKAHPVIDEILENNEDVKVQIIFTATNDENDHRAETVRHFMAIEDKKDSNLIKHALDDWYGANKKDYDVFAEKYPLNGELKLQAQKLDAMSTWCKEADISFTPTFFINGYQLPESYKIEDLKHLV